MACPAIQLQMEWISDREQAWKEGKIMSKAKNVQITFCMVILFLFMVASQAGAAEWILYEQSPSGALYYDMSSIDKNGNIVRVWTEEIYNQDGKNNAYSILKSLGNPINNPDVLSHQLVLREFDCASGKMQSTILTVYTQSGASVFSQQKSFDEWKDIPPDSASKTLKNIICGSSRQEQQIE
jgi:hypothetical protein